MQDLGCHHYIINRCHCYLQVRIIAIHPVTMLMLLLLLLLAESSEINGLKQETRDIDSTENTLLLTSVPKWVVSAFFKNKN